MPRPRLAMAVACLVTAALGASCRAEGPLPPIATASPIATPADAPPTDAEVEAIRFRTDFGLRADLPYIRAVALDPAASSADFAVPLLPLEIQELRQRVANADAVREIVAAEADAYPQDFCGRYIDNDNGGSFTSMWRANLASHAAAIRMRAGPFAELGFVSCTFSESELNALSDRLFVLQDAEWLAALPAVTTGWGPNVSLNRVEVDISSAVPDAAVRIQERLEDELDLAPGILVVLSDGTGVVLVPYGTVRITVTRPDGDAVGPNGLGLLWISDVDGLSCGGEVGVGVPPDDQPVELPCQEGRWTIRVMDAGEILGEGRVVVHRDVVVDLAITLAKVPPAGE